jgi:hypothetical protein
LLHQRVDDCGIVSCTFLGFVQDFLDAVHRMEQSRFLTRVHIRTKGWLRGPDVPAGVLLSRWERHMQETWGPNGVHITVEVVPHLHARCCSLVGASSTVDVHLEWGLAFWRDTAPTWLRAKGWQ